LKSATTSEAGSSPAVRVADAVRAPVALPSRTVTLSPLRFPTARSARPSVLKSPTAMVWGLAPTVTVVGAAKVPLPLFRKMRMRLLKPSATAMSGPFCPSMSATAGTPVITPVVKNGVGAANVPLPLLMATARVPLLGVVVSLR
jgi:hypothetical protein